MTVLLVLTIIIAIVLWYALQGRKWLKSKSWTEGFFAWIEPIEIALYKKSETILVARLKMFAGIVVTLLTQIGSIDLSPLMPFVPEKYEPFVKVAFNAMPMIITFLGVIDEKLRNGTTKPLELVAVPDKVAAETPAIATAEVAKTEAVAEVVAKAA